MNVVNGYFSEFIFISAQCSADVSVFLLKNRSY